jgi:hypothetical protein
MLFQIAPLHAPALPDPIRHAGSLPPLHHPQIVVLLTRR